MSKVEVNIEDLERGRWCVLGQALEELLKESKLSVNVKLETPGRNYKTYNDDGYEIIPRNGKLIIEVNENE